MDRVTIIAEACKGVEDCGICMFVCPKALFASSKTMNSLGYIPPVVMDGQKCTACKSCMYMCPDFAIVVNVNTTTRSDEEDNE